MISGLVVSFAVIFVAELGDKSQLMALAFATRYPALPVLIGITVATAIVHFFSVVVGVALATALPTTWIAVLAAASFVIFGVWTLRGDMLSDQQRERVDRPSANVALTVGVVFFLAELGDKTMLATISLATSEDSFGTWLGSTLGMVAADALAIVVGHRLGRRLPDRAIRWGAALAFFGFALWLLIEEFV